MTRSFGLDAPIALQHLRSAARRFTEGEFRDELDADLVRDCAIKVWHLSEYAFDVLGPDAGFPDLRSFTRSVKEQCPALECLQEICNETKHVRISRPEPRVADTYAHRGDFSAHDWHPDDFDTSELRVELADGQVYPFRNVLQSAVDFWTDFFERHSLR